MRITKMLPSEISFMNTVLQFVFPKMYSNIFIEITYFSNPAPQKKHTKNPEKTQKKQK
jgi:hypothetical protein